MLLLPPQDDHDQPCSAGRGIPSGSESSFLSCDHALTQPCCAVTWQRDLPPPTPQGAWTSWGSVLPWSWRWTRGSTVCSRSPRRPGIASAAPCGWWWSTAAPPRRPVGGAEEAMMSFIKKKKTKQEIPTIPAKGTARVQFNITPSHPTSTKPEVAHFHTNIQPGQLGHSSQWTTRRIQAFRHFRLSKKKKTDCMTQGHRKAICC